MRRRPAHGPRPPRFPHALEAEFRAIFDSATDGLLVNDPETSRIVEVNPALCAMHGYTRDELIGRHPVAFIHPDYRAQMTEIIPRALSGVFRARVRLVRKDETTFPAEITGTAFQFRGRIHVLSMVRDVTEAEAVEQELERRVAERTGQLESLLRVARSVGSRLETRAVLREILAGLGTVVPYQGASIAMFRDRTLEVLDFRLSSGVFIDPSTFGTGSQIEVPEASLTWGYWRAGRAIAVRDTWDRDDPMAAELDERMTPFLGAAWKATRSWCAVPLMVSGELEGILTLAASEPGVYGPREVDLLTAFGPQASIALANARLFADVERAAKENAALAAVSGALALDRPIEETFRAIGEVVVAATGALACSVALMGDDEQLLTIDGCGLPEGFIAAARALGRGWRPGGALRSIEPRVYRGLHQYAPTGAAADALLPFLRTMDCGSVVTQALLVRGQPIGALNTYFLADEGPSPDALHLLGAITRQATLAVDNVELFRQTSRRAAENAAMAAIASNLTLDRPTVETFEAIARSTMAATGALACSLSLLREDGSLQIVGGAGLPPGFSAAAASLNRGGVPASWDTPAGMEPRIVRGARVAADTDERLRTLLPQLDAIGADVVAAYPLNVRGRLNGALVAYFRDTDEPGPDQHRVLEAIADQAAIAIDNTQLFAETNRRATENAALAAVAASLTLDRPALETYRAIAEEATRAAGALACSISIVDVESTIGTVAAFGLPAAFEEVAIHVPLAAVPTWEGPEARPVVTHRVLADIQPPSPLAPVAPYLEAIGCRSAAAFPMRLRNRQLGGLIAYFADEHAPTDEQYRLLSAITDQAAVAIENTQLFRETNQRSNENAALAAVAANITLGRPLRDTLDTVAASILSATGALTCTISIVDPMTGELEMSGGAGVPAGFVEIAQKAAQRRSSYRNEAIRMGTWLTAHGVRSQLLGDSLFAPLHDQIRDAAWDTVISIPVHYGGRGVGVMQVGYPGDRGPTVDESKVLSAIADQLAVAIENARLFIRADTTATENAAMAAISAAVTVERPIQETLAAICRIIRDFVRAPGCVVYPYDRATASLSRGWSVDGVSNPDGDRLLDLPATPGSSRMVALAGGAPLVTRDLRERVRDHPALAATGVDVESLPWRTLIDVPVVYRGTPMAVVRVVYAEVRDVSADELRALARLADQAAIVLQNATLFDESQRAAVESAGLASIAASGSLEQPIDVTLDAIGEAVAATVGAGAVALYLLGADGLMSLAGGLWGGTPFLNEIFRTLPVEPNSTRLQALASGQPVVIESLKERLATHPGFSAYLDHLDEVPWETTIDIPMYSRGRPLGVMVFCFTHRFRPSADQLRQMTAFAGQSAIVVQNARLYDESEARSRENAALAGIASSGNLEQSLDEIVASICDEVVRTVGIIGSVLYLRDLQTGALQIAGHPWRREPWLDELVTPLPLREGSIRQHAMDSGQVQVVPDLREVVRDHMEATALRDRWEEVTWRTCVIVPLLNRGNSLGVLIFGFPEVFEPSGDQLRQLGAFGAQAAVVIQNARLFEESKRRARENAALASIASEITVAAPMSAFLESIARNAVEASSAQGCAVFLVDMERDLIGATGGYAISPGLLQAIQHNIAASRAFARETLGPNGAAVFVPGARTAMRGNAAFRGIWAELDAETWEGVFVVPVVYRGRPLGTLNVAFAPGDEPSADDRRLFEAMANQAAIAIENVRLFESSEMRVAELEALSGIAASLTVVQPVETTLERLAATVVAATPAVACSLVIFETGTFHAHISAQHGLPPGYIEAAAEALNNPVWRDSVEGFVQSDERLSYEHGPRTFRDDPRWAPLHPFLDQVTWEHTELVPLRYQGRVLGALSCYYPAGYLPSGRDVELLRAIADQASAAVENARLFDEVTTRARQQELLAALSASLKLDRPMAEVLDEVTAQVVHGIRCAAAVAVVCDEQGNIQHIGQHGLPESYIDVVRASALRFPEYWREQQLVDRLIITNGIAELLGGITEMAPLGPMLAGLGLDGFVRVPFAAREAARGALLLYFRGPVPRPSGVPFYEAVADQVFVVVENTRLFGEVRERTRQLSALYRADEELHRSLQMEDVLAALLAVTRDTLQADDCALVLWEPGAIRPRLLNCVSDRHVPEAVQMIEQSLADVGRETFVGAAAGDTVAVFEDTASAAGGFRLRAMQSGVRAMLEVPVRIGDEFFGYLEVVYAVPREFADEEVRLFGSLARRAAVAIENARLYGQAQNLAIVEERQRLARELHDSVSQALYGIALGARTARTLLDRDPRKAVDPVDYVLQLAEAGLAEMRALIFELRPESLATEGIVRAIEKQVASTHARYGIAVDAKLPEEPDLPLPAKEALYRVAQEALHNVVKHARATEVSLVLSMAPGAVTLDLRDNGQGFDTSGEFPGHLGLKSMRERVERAGGSFRITSAHGSGTHLVASVPHTGE